MREMHEESFPRGGGERRTTRWPRGWFRAALLAPFVCVAGCGPRALPDLPVAEEPSAPPTGAAVATFGGGCFWCLEEAFQQQEGVYAAVSGYMGGEAADATYEEVCAGTTGHVEVVQVWFDPERIGYGQLLDLFFLLHDPTTLNRQGNDIGPQYRSVIFHHDDAQREEAEEAIRRLGSSGRFADPLVTAVEPAAPFYRAEEYHQDYYRKNPGAGYCRVVIRPKLEKLGLEH